MIFRGALNHKALILIEVLIVSGEINDQSNNNIELKG
jgi:hypothetical protein